MSHPLAPAVRDRIFRASARYRLRLWDRLAPAEKQAVAELRRDPDFYGVLVPAEGAAGTVKAVDRETALLLLTLREPGPLPEYALAGHDAEARTRALAALVLDGVLEVLAEQRFVSGSEALAALRLAPGEAGDGGALGRLSRRALDYAALYQAPEPTGLQQVLYHFNRAPLTPRWRRELADGGAVRGFLGIAPGGPARARLTAGWSAAPPDPEGAWLSWSPRRGDPHAGAALPIYKLYLSPRLDALADGFACLLDTLSRHANRGFKVGADAAGLVRPDKLVAYFSSFDDLAAAADDLRRRLGDTPAHGVPFTAEIGAGGALSWGMDPPGAEAAAAGGGRESWRTWVTGRLASALWSARRGGAEPRDAARLALERLRLEGVDVERWTPSATVWGAS